jgi:hypothetical protein
MPSQLSGRLRVVDGATEVVVTGAKSGTADRELKKVAGVNNDWRLSSQLLST